MSVMNVEKSPVKLVRNADDKILGSRIWKKQWYLEWTMDESLFFKIYVLFEEWSV